MNIKYTQRLKNIPKYTQRLPFSDRKSIENSPGSVVWGASFPDLVILDVDHYLLEDVVDGLPRKHARSISNRFSLGDCLLVLSSQEARPTGETFCNLYMVFDRIVDWPRVHHIITTLAQEGFLEETLASMNLSRGDFTSRLSRKHGDDIPVPIEYVKVGHTSLGGIDRWLQAWQVGLKADPSLISSIRRIYKIRSLSSTGTLGLPGRNLPRSGKLGRSGMAARFNLAVRQDSGKGSNKGVSPRAQGGFDRRWGFLGGQWPPKSEGKMRTSGMEA